MLNIEKRTGGILHIRADGQLTTNEYAKFVPQFEQLAGRGSPILIELGADFTGWTLGALWRDLKFDVQHYEQFGRIAVLGDKKWEKWGTEASSVAFPGTIRFFELSDRLKAEQWLREAFTAGAGR